MSECKVSVGLGVEVDRHMEFRRNLGFPLFGH